MAAYPGGFNTFVPSFDATGNLVVEFSRNPKDFALNQYITLTPVKKSVGYFLRITAEQAARVINSALLTDFVWPDGNDAPNGAWGTEAFQFFPYNTTRYAFPFRLGYKAVEQADWKILASHAAIAAQDAMTARTIRVITALLNSANYSASHVTTAKLWQNQLGATQTFWSQGTTTNPAIKNSLNAAAQQIQLDTLAKVKVKDLVVVIGPPAAALMAQSAEINDYLARSPFAMAQVRGDVPSQNGVWGLPDTLYGFKVVVEDAVVVTSRKNAAARAASYAFTANQAAVVARPGGLTAPSGGPSYSTVHVFAYEEMTAEQRDDPDNRRTMGRVVEDYDVEIVAPASGAIITNLFS